MHIAMGSSLGPSTCVVPPDKESFDLGFACFCHLLQMLAGKCTMLRLKVTVPAASTDPARSCKAFRAQVSPETKRDPKTCVSV